MPPKITRVRWSASDLPWGISFNEQTGTFTGTPDKDAVGEYDIPVTVETNFGEHQQYLHINVLEKVEWEEVALPSSHIIKKNMPVIPLATVNSAGNITNIRIVVICEYENSSGTRYYNSIYATTLPPSSWSTHSGNVSITSSTGILAGIGKIYGVAPYNLGPSYGLACSFNDSKIIKITTSGFSKITPAYTQSTWMACCYCPVKSAMFYFAKNGTAVKVLSFTGTPTAKNSYSTGISNINPACGAHNGLKMCITSANYQSATSEDGETWQIGSTPDNLIELRYESSLSKFMARGENTNLFFVSDDGLTWTQYNYTPPPLNTVKSVAYSSAYGFCAVGIGEDGTETHSAHSQDGENWTLKKITNKENIFFTNVIYAGGSINSFVAAPTTGSYVSGSYIYRIKGINSYS